MKRKTILLLSFVLLIFITGCNEIFVEIEQPQNSTAGVPFRVNLSIHTNSGSGEQALFAFMIPETWNLTNLTTTYYDLNESDFVDDTITYSNQANNSCAVVRPGYKWVVLRSQNTISVVNGFESGVLYLNATTTETQLNISYAIGNTNNMFTDCINTSDFCGGTYGECDCGGIVVDDFTLKQDLSCGGYGLRTLANDIMLNCNGTTIDGLGNIYEGVTVKGNSDISIQNCTIKGFNEGLYTQYADNILITNNHLTENAIGIDMTESDGGEITRNKINNTEDAMTLFITSGNSIWLNKIYGKGIDDVGTNNYCFNGQGNFYEEFISPVGIGSNDCGPSNITDTIGGVIEEDNIQVTWTEQSSIESVVYNLLYSNYPWNIWTKIAEINDYTTINDPSIVFAYNFEDGLGTTTTDVSGNGNTGQVGGIPTYDSGQGYYSGAYLFDGNNDYVAAPVGIDDSGNVTFEVWVYPTSTTVSGRQVVSTERFSNRDWSIIQTYGKWFVYTGSTVADPDFTLDKNTWQHIVAVFRPTGSNAGIEFYKNGTKSSVPISISPRSDNMNVSIGAKYVAGNPFPGIIDSVVVYNRALSEEEIQEHAKYIPGNLSYNWSIANLPDDQYKIRLVPSNGEANATNPIKNFSKNCVVPTDDLYINENTDLCELEQQINDTGQLGVIIINNSNLVLDCKNTSIIGNNSGFGIISYGHDNVVIKNCNISNYEIGIGMSDYANNIQNNVISFNYWGLKLNNFNMGSVEENLIEFNAYGVLMGNSTLNDLTRNNVSGNSYSGFALIDNSEQNSLTQNRATDNDNGFYLSSSDECNLTQNVAYNNNNGVILNFSFSNMIKGNIIQDNNQGYVFDGSNLNIIINENISNSVEDITFMSSINNILYDIELSGTHNINSMGSSFNQLFNSSFGSANIEYNDDSSLEAGWYFEGYVEDEEGTPIRDLKVNANGQNNRNFQTLTNGQGVFELDVVEIRENSSDSINFNNYSINFSKDSYTNYYMDLNINQNYFVNISLNTTGGIPDTVPPTAPAVVDGLSYVDRDWTNSLTTLDASWYNSTDRSKIFYSYRIFEDGVCIPDYCSETFVDENTQVSVPGLELTEGNNYSFAVRARDTFYYSSNYSFSDGIVVDVTLPESYINSSTHPDPEEYYSNPNVTLEFYGNDSASGIDGLSYLLNQDPGTAPDTVKESKSAILMSEMKNNGPEIQLRGNDTEETSVLFKEVIGNLSQGDKVTVSIAIAEKRSETSDKMLIKSYIVPGDTNIDIFDETPRSVTNIVTHSLDVSYNPISNAEVYSIELTVNEDVSDSFYVAVAGVVSNNNTNSLVIGGSETEIDNLTESYICNSTGSCGDLTEDMEFAIKVEKEDTRDKWYKSYYNLENGVYWFHVRALDVAGNWGETTHFRINIDAINGTPTITTLKPRGCVVQVNPKLIVETDEYTVCYYNNTNNSNTKMTSYNGLYHEVPLTISEGDYEYSVNCTDNAGNSIYETAEFTIDLDATPNLVVIAPMDTYSANQRITTNVNVTGTCNTLTSGLEGLAEDFSTSVVREGNENSFYSSVEDLGNGIYALSFDGPSEIGVYTLRVNVRGVLDSEGFNIETHTVTVRYTSSSLGSTKEYGMMGYSSADGYIIGVASDSNTTSIDTGGSFVSVSKRVGDNSAFIFLTKPTADVRDVSEYLEDQSFLDLINPSFGYHFTDDGILVITSLDYENIQIEGLDQVSSGRYTLLIKNEGIDESTGKIKVSITIV